jgi:elongation factor Ts
MHIAATKPRALDAAGVPEADIATERSVAEQKAAESGKPPEIVTKMVEGSIQKFLKEVTLLSQPFVKNDKQSVAQMLKEKNASIRQFALYVVGEGIEKKSEDFAAEVAAAAAGAA